MLVGHFSGAGTRRRPFVSIDIQFPVLSNQRISVDLLVDTGADRTVLAPSDAAKLDIHITTLPQGRPSIGIGGRRHIHTIDAVVILGTTEIHLPLAILAPEASPLPLPSVLGRDILRYFALFLEERTDRVLLLDPEEAGTLPLPR